MSQKNQRYHEQQLNPTVIDFQIQRDHSFILPKYCVRRELRNSKESRIVESENKSQPLYCIDESATENDFSLSQKMPISVKIGR